VVVGATEGEPNTMPGGGDKPLPKGEDVGGCATEGEPNTMPGRGDMPLPKGEDVGVVALTEELPAETAGAAANKGLAAAPHTEKVF